MSSQLTRRDFAIRTAGFGLAGFNLATGHAPAATLAETEQASRSETSPPVADPYSLVDPELLPVLKQFPAFDLSAEMVAQFRQTPGLPPLPAPAPQPVERHIPGPPGAPEVRLWIVDPAPLEEGQAVVASHAWRRLHDGRSHVDASAPGDRDGLPLRRRLG